jgi:hypothetical protein
MKQYKEQRLEMPRGKQNRLITTTNGKTTMKI